MKKYYQCKKTLEIYELGVGSKKNQLLLSINNTLTIREMLYVIKQKDKHSFHSINIVCRLKKK